MLMLDTHVFAWFASNRRKLSRVEREAIEQHNESLIVSVISIWELRLLWRSNPGKAETDALIKPHTALLFCGARRIPVLPFTAVEAVTSLDPPLAHKDPFDDVIMSHAQTVGAKLLTRDGDLLGHPVAYSP